MDTEAVVKEARVGRDERFVTVVVNGSPVSIEKTTTVGALLNEAGYAPDNHYLVRIEHDKEVKDYRDVSEPITLHEDEEFRAYYNGATPLS